MGRIAKDFLVISIVFVLCTILSEVVEMFKQDNVVGSIKTLVVWIFFAAIVNNLRFHRPAKG